MQSIYQFYLPSAVVAAAVLWNSFYSCQQTWRTHGIKIKNNNKTKGYHRFKNNCIEAPRNKNTQSIDQLYLPSNVVAAAVFLYCCYFYRWS